MRILVDEDSPARSQLNILRSDGHDVVAVGELDKNGTPDPEIFELTQLLERVLLTHNTEDFHELHTESGPSIGESWQSFATPIRART